MNIGELVQAKTVDYSAIAGGVGEISISTMVHGGESVVIGGVAKSSARDRVLHLKYVGDDVRSLLGVIGMARPLTWGKLEYDDGSVGPKIAKAKGDPDAALMAELKARLAMPPSKVAKLLASEFNLAEPVTIALVDMIKLLIGHLKKHKPNSRPVAIDGSAGEILARLEDGADYFKISTNATDAKVPSTLSAIARDLLNTMVKIKCDRPSNTPMDAAPTLKRPSWPDIPSSVLDKMESANVKGEACATVRACVEAIVMREHELIGHMDAIEQYYSDSAKDIISYTGALQQHFEACA